MVKAHESLTSVHGGVTKTLERLKRFFYWPRMTLQVRQHVENCQICKESKSCNHYLMPGIGQEVVTERLFQKLYIYIFWENIPDLKVEILIYPSLWLTPPKFTFLKAMR